MTDRSPFAPAHSRGFDRRGALKSVGFSLTINALCLLVSPVVGVVTIVALLA
jgi:hypothetical protein